MKNYSIFKKEEGARIELHDRLGLTWAEISINTLPANTNVPFVHSHKENEEIYYIISGNGKFVIDGEELALFAGDFVKVNPQGKRQIFAGEEGISYLCIQVKVNLLEEYTTNDAIIG